MKTIARDVVQVHYKEELYPVLDFGHNSADLMKIIAENVNELVKSPRLHIAPTPDASVRPV